MEWITEVLKEHFGSFIGMVFIGLSGLVFRATKTTNGATNLRT